MNYNIETIPLFDKQVKILSKKYPSIKNDLRVLVELLLNNPLLGTSIGNNFYKIRIAIASKSKSAGARVITFIKISATTVYLSFIYDKSDKSTITNKELENIFNSIPNN